jgi:hypothetical protein
MTRKLITDTDIFGEKSQHVVMGTGHVFTFPYTVEEQVDRLCGLVVRVSGYKSGGPGFDSRPYQIL